MRFKRTRKPLPYGPQGAPRWKVTKINPNRDNAYGQVHSSTRQQSTVLVPALTVTQIGSIAHS